MLVTVVTPSYNQGLYVARTIESVIIQRYPHLEYMVIDGGSTDNSKEIIKSYEGHITYWVSEPDKGQADAINRGWQRSRGEILAWINSDDTYEPKAISHVVELFERHPEVDVVTADCRVIDETGCELYNLPSGEFDIRTILAGNSLPQQGVFCRRAAVEAVGWLDVESRYVFDWALWVKLWLNGAKFRHLPRTIANFRVWGASKTGGSTIGASLSGGIPFARERLQTIAKLLGTARVQNSPIKRTLLHSAKNGNLLELSLLHYLSSEPFEAHAFIEQCSNEVLTRDLSLSYAQSLAAHLAFLDTDVEEAIDGFLCLLAQHKISAERNRAWRHWRQALQNETQLVRAWHAVHSCNIRLAARLFLGAIGSNPSLISQRRVVSPAIRSIVKVAGAYVPIAKTKCTTHS